MDYDVVIPKSVNLQRAFQSYLLTLLYPLGGSSAPALLQSKSAADHGDSTLLLVLSKGPIDHIYCVTSQLHFHLNN